MEPSKLPPLDPSQIPPPTQSLQPEPKKRKREEQQEENLLPTPQSNLAPDSSQLEKRQVANLDEQIRAKALRKETDTSIGTPITSPGTSIPQLTSGPKAPIGRGIPQTLLLPQGRGLGRGPPPLPYYGQQSQGYQHYPPQGYPPQGYQSYPPQGYPPQGFAESPSGPQTSIQPSPPQRTQQTPYGPQSQGHQPPIQSYSPQQQKKLESSQELSNTTTTSISPSVQGIYPQSYVPSKNPTSSLPLKAEITNNPQAPGKPPPPKSTEWRFEGLSDRDQVDKAGLAHDLRKLDAPTALKNHMQHRLDNFQVSCQHLLGKKDSTRNYRDIQMIAPFDTKATHYFLPQGCSPESIPRGYERTHNSLFPAIRVVRSSKTEELNDKELYAILNAVDIAPGIVNRLDDEIEQGPVSSDILAQIKLSYAQVGSSGLTGREFARELLNQVYAGSLDLSVASHYLGQHISATLQNVAKGQFVTSRQIPLTSTEKGSMQTLAATYFV